MDQIKMISKTSQATIAEVYDGFKEHHDAHRVSTELVVLELLRKSYPEFHVTCISPSRCDLLGYANAGHATASIDSDQAFDATRSYKEPGPRLGKKPGILYDHIRFGRWLYIWKHHEYILYQVEYTDPMRPPTTIHFLLSSGANSASKQATKSATDELLLAVGAWSTDLHEEIYVFDEGYWSKSHELWESVQGCSWDEVILNSNMKANLVEDVQGFFDNQLLYKKLAVPWKRGLILHGLPGNGKTISIKAFINSLSTRPDPVPSLYVKSFDACKGNKYAIRAIFSHARIMAPCLLIFEDLDSLVTNETRSYFLNEVDGLESNDGILMIGSTNHLDKLDPAISKRPSRFDRKYCFQIPGFEERVAYCQFWRRKLLDSDMVDFPDELCPVIAKLTEGFSFAYLKELFVIALLTVARGGIPEGDDVESDLEAPRNNDTSSAASTDSHVVVEHEDTTEEPPQPIEQAASTENASTLKKTIPEVEIPASLTELVLLKVIRAQMKILIEEMDSTKDGGAAVGKVAGGGFPGANMARMMMRSQFGGAIAFRG